MILVRSFMVFELLTLLATSPTSKDDAVIIAQSFYIEDYVKYRGKYDIVKILVPLNALNFDESSSSEFNEMLTKMTIFFVEAEFMSDNSLLYQGLYVFKHGKATKILENGRDAAASGDDSKLVFLATTDGLYVYNHNTESAEKYGQILESLIGIEKEEKGEVIYILTYYKKVFKVTNNGDTAVQIEEIIDPMQIVLDYSNNIYYYNSNMELYVYTHTCVKRIKGLPKFYSSVSLIRPPNVFKDCVPVLIDNQVYIIYANGTSERHRMEFKLKAKPTAYAPEAVSIQYYAHRKKIYEYNILDLVSSAIKKDLNNYLADNSSHNLRPTSKPICLAEV